MRIDRSTTAVVTGAGGGLGRAIALELGKRGARVLVSDVRGEAAEETAELVQKAGGRADPTQCDVSRAESIDELAAMADELFGATTLLVNNAGVGVAGPIDTIPLEDWRWIMDINLWGVIYGCRTFVPRMKRAGGGHILNVASIAGIASPPEMSPYNVTKAGVIALSETLAAELADHRIGVTALCPFFFRTNIAESGRTANKDEKRAAAIRKLMERNPVQAPEVAKIAIDACERGQLYCLPHREARAIWALKRLTGEHFRRAVKLMTPR